MSAYFETWALNPRICKRAATTETSLWRLLHVRRKRYCAYPGGPGGAVPRGHQVIERPVTSNIHWFSFKACLPWGGTNVNLANSPYALTYAPLYGVQKWRWTLLSSPLASCYCHCYIQCVTPATSQLLRGWVGGWGGTPRMEVVDSKTPEFEDTLVLLRMYNLSTCHA